MAYPGGKGGDGVYQKLINLIPPHNVYIESHLGYGSVYRYKRLSAVSYLVDINPNVIASFGDAGHNSFLVCADAVEFLSSYHWVGGEFVYADPPYVMASRSVRRSYYDYEYTDFQHEELLNCLMGLPCQVMISGYVSDLYFSRLADWTVFTFQAVTRSGRLADEFVWMNYPVPVALHDYRYLGDNFRERERIKRKKLRWLSRLRSMSLLERQAMLSAIDEAFSPPVSSNIAILPAGAALLDMAVATGAGIVIPGDIDHKNNIVKR